MGTKLAAWLGGQLKERDVTAQTVAARARVGEATISDILINGPKQVYIERFGKLEMTEVRFDNDGHLMKIIDRIVSKVGRRIDESMLTEPCCR